MENNNNDNEYLSRDISMTDMFAGMEEPEEVKEETVVAETGDAELDAILNDISGESNTTEQTTEAVSDSVTSAIDSVEQLKASTEGDTNELSDETSKIIDELYTELLKADTNANALETANKVLMSKVNELQEKVTNYETTVGESQSSIDNPDLMIIQSNIDSALAGDQSALDATKEKLESMYKQLFGSTIEETQVNSNLEGQPTDDISFGGGTTIPEEPIVLEESDPKSITSIFA